MIFSRVCHKFITESIKYKLWLFVEHFLFSLYQIQPCNPSTVSVDRTFLSQRFDMSSSSSLSALATDKLEMRAKCECFLREFIGKIFVRKLLNWVGICCAMHFVLFAFFRPRIFHTSRLPQKCNANSWKLVTPWDAFSPSIQRSICEMEIMDSLRIDRRESYNFKLKSIFYILTEYYYQLRIIQYTI